MTLPETLERVRSMAAPGNEEAAKIQIILPVLDALGWDTRDPAQVRYEYSVGAGGQTSRGGGGKADIALISSQGSPVALIEAKSPGQDLKRHVTQMLGYAFHEGVTICVLANGPHWWLYLPREAGQPMERRFAELELLADPPDQVASDLESFLSRKALNGGSAETRARQVLKARRETDRLNEKLPALWQTILGKPSGTPHSELVELVSKHAYEQTGLRPAPEQIVDVIQDRPISPAASGEAAPPATSAASAQPARREGATKKDKKKGQRSPKPTAFVLWGQRHAVRYYYEIPVGVAEALHARHPHDFQRIEQVRMRVVNQDPGELRTPKKVGNTGWYVNANWNARNHLLHARQFLENFGYDPNDLEVLYE